MRIPQVFKTDAGATYDLLPQGEDDIAVRGNHCTYYSDENMVIPTGKVRYHGRFGMAQRARLILDTGEGLSEIPGLLLVPSE